MPAPVSVVVPARNEAATIRKVVETLLVMPDIAEVVVVDNASDDDTAVVAATAGARVVYEPQAGMGYAVRTGLAAAQHDWVMKIDADLDKFDIALFARMGQARGPGIGLIKGVWQDPKDNMPMTRLLVMPAIRQIFPGLAHLRAPNSGIYMVNRSLIAPGELTGNYAADLDVMLRVHAAGAQVAEVDIGQIAHDQRNLGHYNAMAETILSFFLRQSELQITQEVVVMAQGAEQVIANSLGVLAARSKSGGPVSVFLSETDTAAAAALRDALAPFPTARIQALEQAGGYLPRPTASRLKIFAPYPAANEDQAIHAALDLLDSAEPALQAELLLMPLGPERGAVDGFRADIALEIGNGAEIKSTALARIAPIMSGPAKTGPRELFQSYASLPDPLKSAMSPKLRSEAGNM